MITKKNQKKNYKKVKQTKNKNLWKQIYYKINAIKILILKK